MTSLVWKNSTVNNCFYLYFLLLYSSPLNKIQKILNNYLLQFLL